MEEKHARLLMECKTEKKRVIIEFRERSDEVTAFNYTWKSQRIHCLFAAAHLVNHSRIRNKSKPCYTHRLLQFEV